LEQPLAANQPENRMTRQTESSQRIAPTKAKLKVALVEDHARVRDNWCRLINSFPDLSCICTCKSGEEALRIIPPLQPDVVLMDIFLPRMSGVECTARLKAMSLRTQIIILTAMEDEELIYMALEAGADGYLLKRTEPADLRLALLDVLKGGAPMTSVIARRLIESFRQKSTSQKIGVSLSVREEQILTLLSKGYSNKMIAERLDVSIDTVCYHLKRIFEKMHVRSRTEAVARFMTPNPPAPGSD